MDKRKQNTALNDSLNLIFVASSNVTDGPGGFLHNVLFGVVQQARENFQCSSFNNNVSLQQKTPKCQN